MRRPTVADVLEAVTYVSGVDPRTDDQYPRTMRSRKLAVHALREITECSYREIATALGYADAKSVFTHLQQPPDHEDLRLVLEEVAAAVGPLRETTPRRRGAAARP